MTHEYKVGDAVALVSRAGFGSKLYLEKGKVERVTRTQIVALGGRRFNAKSGLEIGVSASRFGFTPRLSLLTQELLEEELKIKTENDAVSKCLMWADALQRARGDKAVALAAMLPDDVPT